MKDSSIEVTVTPGPSVFNTGDFTPLKYLSIGVKYSVVEILSLDVKNFEIDFIVRILDNIKNAILKLKEQILENTFSDDNSETTYLTDKFFEYLKNNNTKIQAIRVSLTDYENDYKSSKLHTIKILKTLVITADDESLNNAFDTIVKELYYIYGTNVIDLYSIILTPKMYKIINNIPVEHRGILIRVKK